MMGGTCRYEIVIVLCASQTISRAQRCVLAAAASESALTTDSRVQGTLRGFDQMTNVILEDCKERVYAPDQVRSTTAQSLEVE